MQLRSFLILISAALLSAIPVQAEELEQSPFDPPAIFGQDWQRVDLSVETNSIWPPVIHRRNDALLVKADALVAADIHSVDIIPNPRPQFDPETASIAFDGDSPVFWTLPVDPASGQDFSIRDWSSGQVIGTLQADAESPLRQPSKYLLDDHGLVALTTTELITTDLSGGNLRRVNLPKPAHSYGIATTATSEWIVASLYWTDNSPAETLVWDRKTLELKSQVTGAKYYLSAYGNLLASGTNDEVRIHSLPDLVSLTVLPKPNTGYTVIKQVELGANGVWVRQVGTTQQLHTLQLFDLTVMRDRYVKKSLQTPAVPRAVHMADDAIAVVGPAGDLYIWHQPPALPDLEILAGNSLKEGDSAIGKVRLLSPSLHPVTVEIETSEATAKPGSDYVPISQQLTIPAGQTEAEFSIETIVDSELEPYETFTVRVTSVSGANLTKSSATILIVGNGFNLDIASSTFGRSDRQWSRITAYAAGKLLGSSRRLPIQGYDYAPTIMTLEGGLTDQILPSGAYSGSTSYVKGNVVAWAVNLSLSAMNIETGEAIATNLTAPGYLVGLLDSNHALVEVNPSTFNSRLVKLRLSDGGIVAETNLEPYETLLSSSQIAKVANLGPILPDDRIFIGSTRRDIHQTLQYTDHLRELDPTTLQVLRTWNWQSKSQSQSGIGRILASSEGILVSLNSNELIGFDTNTEQVLWRLPASGRDFTFAGISKGMLLIATGDNFSDYVTNQALTVYDLRTGGYLQSYSVSQLFSGATYQANQQARIFPENSGWLVTLGASACRIRHTDLVPNFVINIPTFYDNQEVTVSVTAREDFEGSFGTHWFEYFGNYEKASRSNATVFPYLGNLDISASGQSFTIGSFRLVEGPQLIRFALDTQTWESSDSTHPPYPRRLMGTTTFSILPHTVSKTWKPLAASAPSRNSRAATLAVSDRYLAVGFPGESLTIGNTTTPDSKVDVFDIVNEQHLYTINSSELDKTWGLGMSLAFSRDRLLIGAPGNGTDGKVYIFDPETGRRLNTIYAPFGARAFGASVAANDERIVIGAPATYSTEGLGDTATASYFYCSVHVYNATTLLPEFSKTQYGEMLGHSVALFGNRVAAGSPLLTSASLPVVNGGGIRIYDIATKSEIEGILPADPSLRGYFGSTIAGNSTGLSMAPVKLSQINSSGHAHMTADGQTIVAHGMPGETSEIRTLSMFHDVTITGGRTIRFYRSSQLRPYTSITNPGSVSSTPITDGTRLFVANGSQVLVSDFPRPSLSDEDANGRINDFDWLLEANPQAQLPEAPTFGTTNDGTTFTASIPKPTEFNVAWELTLHESTDLNLWEKRLTWSSSLDAWVDRNSQAMPQTADGATIIETLPENSKSFLRYQLDPKNW